MLHSLVGLAAQTLDVVKQGGELKGGRSSGIQPQRPAPGIQGVVVVGAHERLAQVEQRPVAA